MPSRDHPGVRALQEQYDLIEKRNAEAMERQNKTKPTPTQAENDLARLGLLDPMEPKEDHGAESEEDFRRRELHEAERNLSAPRAPGYQTRDMAREPVHARGDTPAEPRPRNK